MFFAFIFSFLIAWISYSRDLPPAPTDAGHPGSKVYMHAMEHRHLQCENRKVDVFVPTLTDSVLPVVVFGHGQALSLTHYQRTFEHLAKKGIGVIFPQYSTGFFDTNWTRMADDYLNLTSCARAQTPEFQNWKLIFSGHSKGAFVASIAASRSMKKSSHFRPQSLIFFAMAGVEENQVGAIDQNIPITLVHSDQDWVVAKAHSEIFFHASRSQCKQIINLKSYRHLSAGHMWPLTRRSFFGGGVEGPLHYHGLWKWLIGAAIDSTEKYNCSNPYIYGAFATDKGVPNLRDDVIRNF